MSQYTEIVKPKIVPQSTSKSDSVPPPPGYTESSFSASSSITSSKTAASAKKFKQDEAELNSLKSKKIWELAIGPAKSVPMNIFMSYMTGNSLQIIPVTMTLMLLWNPLKAIFNDTNLVFAKLSTKDNGGEIVQARLVFVVCQLLNMAVGVYKLYKMGLIPHQEADWLAWKEPKAFIEKLYY
ncbi:ER membrane protein complex subunit 4 [Candida viswanathii]|uniref:ER membrane protein complex subunit 4 n=1 Tax=Candida viswanathii TaxID=5486 RepID=A0A367YJ11_9ASCO|nr:ER membrane protein complex subunit 4 [Candida viswanathii]